MRWSVNQKKAIDALGKNVVVSASAGAGKTAVLTERLKKRIAVDHVPVTSILAMTFTEAAASEMKARLFNALSDSLAKEKDEHQRSFLQEQLVLLGSAHVSTIHSFCLSVIKENYFMINLDPKTASNILSDEECLVLKEQAWNLAFSDMMSFHHNEFVLLCDYFSGRSDDVSALKKCVLKLAQVFSESDDVESTAERYRQYLKPLKTLDEVHPDILQLFVDSCSAYALCIENALDEALDLIYRLDADAAEFQNHVQIRKEKLTELKEPLSQRNYREIYRILRNCAETPLGRVTKIEELKPVRKKITDSCNEAVSYLLSEEQLIQSINESAPYGMLLIDFAMKIHFIYSDLKLKQQAMDFSDMEQFALRILLADNQKTAKKIQRQFVDILVDEFQDTNDVQNTIIELISRGDNIFRVGDIKQSIYRFRGARPQIMRDLLHCDDGSQEIIFLSENYRSCESIVQFNNYLFDILMNIHGLSQEYTSSDWVSIGTSTQDDHHEYPVEFHALTFEKSDEEEMSDLKADYIAKQILSMKQTSEFKKWSDYCVLVRSHEVKDKLRYSFDKYAIPNAMAVKSGFYKSSSIQEIISFFKLLIQPEDDLSMVALMTSSMYKMTFDELTQIRIENKNRSYYECFNVLNYEFIQHYNQVKDTLFHSGLLCACKKILEINDYYLHLSVQEQTNIDLFIDRISDYEQKNGSSLTQYLNFLNTILDQPTSEAISSSVFDDVVRVMTVHQSKGLQFPVVFFWSTFGSRSMDSAEKCMIDSSYGLGLQHLSTPYRIKRPTLQRLALEHRNTIEEFEENIRLLYVATTRPQKKLILVDQVKENYTPSVVSLSTLYARKGFSDLLLSGMNQFDSYQRILPVVVHAEKAPWLPTSQSVQSVIQRWEKKEPLVSLSTPSSLEAKMSLELNLSSYRANQRGTQLHQLVEQLPASPWTESQIVSLNPNLYGGDVQKLLQLGTHPLFLSLQNQEIHKEYSFIFRENNMISHGFIDFLAIDDQKVTMIDFKSDRHVTDEILIERYSSQISAYLHALNHLYPKHQIEAYIYSFDLNKMIKMN